MATIYWRPGGKRYQPGASAYLNWSENLQQFRRSLGKLTPAAAEKIRSAKAAELEHGVRILPRGPRAAEFFEWYQQWYAASHPTTAKRLASELKSFLAEFGDRPIDAISPKDIESWKIARLQTHAPETVGKEIRRVKAALARGIAWKEIDTNPIKHVSAPRGTRDVAVVFYSTDQIAALYEANPQRAPLWALAVNTGMRRGELAKATKADIATYGNGQRIRIESTPDDDTGAGRTKSGKWREVPLNRDALKAISALPHALASGVHADTLSDWFAIDAARADIGGSLHRLRHTFCAHLAIAGVPLRRIQVLAGHSDYKVTERYAHLSPQGGSDAVDLLSFAPTSTRT